MILTIQCPDRPGIISATTQAILESGGNIIDLDQHTAVDAQLFFMRVTIDTSREFSPSTLTTRLRELKTNFNLEYWLHDPQNPLKVGILVSKTSHCLYELLLQHQSKHLDCEIPVILSNHEDLEPIAQYFNIPFIHIPTDNGKERHEQNIRETLEKYNCEFVVMARYMQILSESFTKDWHHKILNIHHGFLPAFQGAKPYHQAWNKGVKIIGATAHFATADLDQGPIVSQDIIHVSDKCSIKDFVHKGQDIERKVLLDALRLILDKRVFIHNKRTFILGK
jgi:formyltetrahydrofolate deformylase